MKCVIIAPFIAVLPAMAAHAESRAFDREGTVIA
jgi:hypothetical protein